MRLAVARQMIKNKEVKVYTSKDYYKDKLKRGSNGYYAPLEEPEDDPVICETKKFPNLLVCIDNGHASTTGGKRSPYAAYKTPPALELYEYKFNRLVAKRLKEKLEEVGVEVYMVCPEVDRDISLTNRYTRANNAAAAAKKKAVLVSIHANAYGTGKEWNSANGWCAYTTKGQNNSDKFAECLYNAAEEIFVPLGKKIRKDFSDGDRDWESNFTIILGANMPAVLTENFFYTNVNDCQYLLTSQAIEDIAEVHFKGIIEFAEKQYRM